MSRPERLERVGVVVAAVLVAVFVVRLGGDLAAAAMPRAAFTALVLAGSVAAGGTVAYYDVVGYETAWAFALGAWLAGVVLVVALEPQGRVVLLLVADTLDAAAYRAAALVPATLAGVAFAGFWTRYA